MWSAAAKSGESIWGFVESHMCRGRRLEGEAGTMSIIWGCVSTLVLAFGFTAFAQETSEAPLRDVFFDRGEFTLREDAKPVLRENAEFLVMNPGVEVEITGYCSAYENAAGNLGLKRAEAVRQYLVEQGVNLSSISVGADCVGGSVGSEIPAGPAEVKAALDSRVGIKAGPQSWPGVL